MEKNSGFTLLEVLVAMIIMAGGLLGLAGLQATSLKNNQTAYNRSQATQLAYDMADRMRANRTYAKTVTNNNYLLTTKPTEGVDGCLSSEDGGCTTAQMATNDIFEWNQAVADALPGGTGTVTVAGNVFTIRVNWPENRYDNTTGRMVTQTSTFLMSFQL